MTEWVSVEERLPEVNEIVWIYWRNREVLLGCRTPDSAPSEGWYSLEDEKCRWAHWWMYYTACDDTPKPPEIQD